MVNGNNNAFKNLLCKQYGNIYRKILYGKEICECDTTVSLAL